MPLNLPEDVHSESSVTAASHPISMKHCACENPDDSRYLRSVSQWTCFRNHLFDGNIQSVSDGASL